MMEKATSLVHGDVLERLREMEPDSVDAVVTDPPYGIRFMGKAWDGRDIEEMYDDRLGYSQDPDPRAGARGGHRSVAAQAGKYDRSLSANQRFQEWCCAWAVEALRVLKPGGHLVAFGGTRTHHRLWCALEDAGFEIRDTLMWLCGSGFPKSLDVSKAIDKAAGAEREVVGRSARHGGGVVGAATSYEISPDVPDVTAPATDAARQWDGWGTALKPAWEPIVLARKPLSGTVAANVQAHGTGALNVDGCRIEATDKTPFPVGYDRGFGKTYAGDAYSVAQKRDADPDPAGRWPANVVLDEEAAAMLDAQSGELTSGANPTRRGSDKFRDIYSDFKGQEECLAARGVDSGGASRFFYCAKASRAEREAGVGGEEKPLRWSSGPKNPGSFQADGTKRAARNAHPTVKPVDLMRWLVRLVTPPGGIILDPFIGSGTTAVAAILEGFDCIGVDNNEEYLATAHERIERARLEAKHGAEGAEAIEAGQGTLM